MGKAVTGAMEGPQVIQKDVMVAMVEVAEMVAMEVTVATFLSLS